MAIARIDGADIYFVETGSGLPCIALHGGLGFDHTYLRSTLRPLEDVIRFIYPDHRANGRSERVPLETVTIAQLAEDVEGLRSHLGLDEIAVLGHSYGGFVALEYATRFPERVTHLIALSTSPGVFSPTQDELAERADPSWITSEVEEALSSFGGPPSKTPEELEARLHLRARAWLYDTPPAVLLEALAETKFEPKVAARGNEALEGWTVAGELASITCPTFVGCGRYDLFTTPECSKRLANAIPGAELVWFERSGHFPWIEEPDAFFEAVRGWLGKV